MLTSPDLRDALVAIATSCHDAPDARPVPPIADADELVPALVRHGLLQLANKPIQASDGPADVKHSVRLHAYAQAMRNTRQDKLGAEALNALSEAGVETIVLKGPALARTVYPHPSLRVSRDLDVLVHQEDWSATHEVLLRLGYRTLTPFEAPPPKVAQHKAYYHTQYLSADQVLLIEVHYDLWWYGLRPALSDKYWERSVPLEMAGAQTRAVSPEDMLLHLCIHLHHHGYDRLIWFTDLLLLLDRNPHLDWDHLVQAARAEGLGIFVYYSLLYLEKLFGVAAPAHVLEALRPNSIQAWLHDRLCPPESVLSVEVADRAGFDLHEVPEATELVLNFLLTGRRLEKLTYLARLLVPPTDWLSSYYGTDDPWALRWRRLIHAPKLISTAIRDLSAAAFRGVVRHNLA